MRVALEGEDPPDSTPLEPEDLEGLIPTFVATRNDLNVAEQANIERATTWLFRRGSTFQPERVLTAEFSRDLHRRMLADVWRWAGSPRQRETNIGVDPLQISTQLQILFDDAAYWHEHETYPSVHRAVRLHHRLVAIHPFRNGNGRHSRLLADVYLRAVNQPRLSWGGGMLVDDDELRRTYIAALGEADRGDYDALLSFAES